MKIAVIGGGVAGIVASYLLQREHDVELFEKNSYLGGHTDTCVLGDGPDEGAAVDTGFIVLNDKNYPTFHEFLNQLRVAVRWSDMSFSYYCRETNLQYAGTTLNGMFAQRQNIISREFLRFLLDLMRFCSAARRDFQAGIDDITLGDYLREKKASRNLIEHYLLPMGAAIWSATFDDILSFPASTFISFFQNHGLLSFRDRPLYLPTSQ